MSVVKTGRVLSTVVVVAIAAALIACSSPTSEPTTSEDVPAHVTAFYSEGGGQETVPQRVIESFLESHPGSTVDSVIGNASFQEIFIAYQTTKKREVDFGLAFTPIHVQQADSIQMLAPLDLSRLSNLAELPDDFITEGGTAVAPTSGVMGIVHREGLENPPTSWMDLLDPRFKGKVGLFDAPQGIYFSGLVEVNDALGGDSATLDKGIAAFEKAAMDGQFSAMYTSNQTQFSALMSGEVDVAVGASLLVGTWLQDGAPFEFVVPEEGGTLVPLYNAMVAGGDKASVDATYWMMNEFSSEENLISLAELFSVPNVPGIPLPEATSKLLGVSNSSDLRGNNLDWAGITSNMSNLTTEWNNRVKVHLGG